MSITPQQHQVLRAIYEWRFVGRRIVGDKNSGNRQRFDGVPLYFLLAQFHEASFEFNAVREILEMKGLITPPGHSDYNDGSWELPDGRIITVKTRAIKNDPPDFVVFIGIRAVVYVDDEPIGDELDAQRIDLTKEGLEYIENANPRLEEKLNGDELRKLAERYVKTHGGVFPGVRPLARILGCPASSLSNAVKASTYLQARKAEANRDKKKARIGPLSRIDLDHHKQEREPDPDSRLEDLIAEQEADQRADSRQMRSRSRS